MGKSSTGPDWTGVIAMTAAMEQLHTCRVVWTGTTAGQGHNGGLKIEMIAHFETLPTTTLPKTVKVTGSWPHASARTMEGMMYNLLWQLDYAIQQAYEQLGIQEA